jgi:hypothetical protein
MSMGKNQASINNIYAALTRNGGPRSEIPAGSNFFIVVKVEAGRAIVIRGAKYNLHVLAQDITNLRNVFNTVVVGNLGDPSWPLANQDASFVFPVPAGPAGTIYKILAVVSIDVRETVAQSFESDPLLVIE